MPPLMTRSYPDTLLDRVLPHASCRQIDYAAIRGVPWGISESAYNAVDRHDTYQYKAFGARSGPEAGARRRVRGGVAYATALAAPLDRPPTASAAICGPAAAGRPRKGSGANGFYEAIDYTHGEAVRSPGRSGGPRACARPARWCAFLPGAPPGHDARRRWPTRCSAIRWLSVFTRTARAGHGACLQERVPRQPMAIPRARRARSTTMRTSYGAPARHRCGATARRIRSSPACAVPLERQLHPRRHERRRRKLPVGATASRSPEVAALTRRAIPGSDVRLPARRAERVEVWSADLPSDGDSSRQDTLAMVAFRVPDRAIAPAPRWTQSVTQLLDIAVASTEDDVADVDGGSRSPTQASRESAKSTSPAVRSRPHSRGRSADLAHRGARQAVSSRSEHAPGQSRRCCATGGGGIRRG